MQETAKVLVNSSIGLCFPCVRGCSCCIKLQIYRLQPAERGGVNYPHRVSSSSPALELPPWGSENPWVPLIEHVLRGHSSPVPHGCVLHVWPPLGFWLTPVAPVLGEEKHRSASSRPAGPVGRRCLHKHLLPLRKIASVRVWSKSS